MCISLGDIHWACSWAWSQPGGVGMTPGTEGTMDAKVFHGENVEIEMGAR